MPLALSDAPACTQFSNGVTATLRTSGTEPKLKFYTEIASSATECDGVDKAALDAELQRTVDAIVVHMLQPEKYGLKRR